MTRPSQSIRAAIEGSSHSRYRIAKATRIAESTLSRFMAGKGLNMESIDALAGYFGLELVRRAKRGTRRRGI